MPSRSRGMSLLLLFVLIAWLVPLLVGCKNEPRPDQLVQERCTRCHTLAPIQGSQKTPEEWRRTVYRMIKKGARLSDAEAEQAIEYLSQVYGPSTP